MDTLRIVNLPSHLSSFHVSLPYCYTSCILQKSAIVLVAFLLTTNVDKIWLLINFTHGKRCSHPLTHCFDWLYPLTFLIARTSLAYMCTSHLFYRNGKRQCVSIKHRNTSVIIYKPPLLRPSPRANTPMGRADRVLVKTKATHRVFSGFNTRTTSLLKGWCAFPATGQTTNDG
jgi:hypothetical protein